MNYRMGQELVCINASPWTDAYTGAPASGPNPIKDEIYHYAGAHHGIFDDIYYIFLEEFGGSSGPGFAASSFRPVVKTDISIFTEMLVKPPHETVPA